MVQRNRQLTVCRCQKVKTVYRGGDGMNKLYDLLNILSMRVSMWLWLKRVWISMSISAFRNYTNRILHRGIQKHYCISLLHFRDCRMFCAQSDPWTKDEEEVSYMFMMFEFMFPIIFVMVFGMIIFQFATGIGTWHKTISHRVCRWMQPSSQSVKVSHIIAMQMRVTCLERMATIRLQVPATMSRFR